MSTETHEIKTEVARIAAEMSRVREEIAKVIVGQEDIVEGVLVCLVAGGHALLEGVPGLGKTRLVRTLAEVLDLSFARIQFTPDLMPSDIVGTTVLSETNTGGRTLEFREGPVFASLVLADEINRATPKTQSALLEVMQERSVTIGRKTHVLAEPHFVLATQNPLEMEGTYPLPEAQLDRFLFKLEVKFPSKDELRAIAERTTGGGEAKPEKVLDRARILDIRRLSRDVVVAPHLTDLAIDVLESTHPGRGLALPEVQRFVHFGASPRGLQAMLVTAKTRALLDGRFAVSKDDLAWAALPALRHRIILNFEGEAEGIATDTLLSRILESLEARRALR
ncbi:MAG: MoxR family ATPase [Myxococcales bacterium]|nr:MoxR family ATPase [Myxococcales bacterium]